MLAALCAYVAFAGERAETVLLSVGALAVTLLVLALATRWSPLLACALIAFGGEYAAFLLLSSGAVDARAPVVAAALLVVAELGYWSLERGIPAAPLRVVLRRLAMLLALASASVPVGILVLAASGASLGRGLVLEAAGVAAAAAAVAFVARLSRRGGETAWTN